ncbi:MAG: hypothetical protein MJE68_19180, partial [Proteobacteria bacterium]|nr:hypothetical protein [Pseudomonadota bacterium]
SFVVGGVGHFLGVYYCRSESVGLRMRKSIGHTSLSKFKLSARLSKERAGSYPHSNSLMRLTIVETQGNNILHLRQCVQGP